MCINELWSGSLKVVSTVCMVERTKGLLEIKLEIDPEILFPYVEGPGV